MTERYDNYPMAEIDLAIWDAELEQRSLGETVLQSGRTVARAVGRVLLHCATASRYWYFPYYQPFQKSDKPD